MKFRWVMALSTTVNLIAVGLVIGLFPTGESSFWRFVAVHQYLVQPLLILLMGILLFVIVRSPRNCGSAIVWFGLTMLVYLGNAYYCFLHGIGEWWELLI
ncbi:MAG: hypothetical protein ACOYOU_09220 [Kiritimatiellia bacterium]